MYHLLILLVNNLNIIALLLVLLCLIVFAVHEILQNIMRANEIIKLLSQGPALYVEAEKNLTPDLMVAYESRINTTAPYTS